MEWASNYQNRPISMPVESLFYNGAYLNAVRNRLESANKAHTLDLFSKFSHVHGGHI